MLQLMRVHASLIIAIFLVVLVTAACIVRTGPQRQRGQPVYVEKHKPQKHKKQKHQKHKH
jgi:hypothetical protein